MYYARVFSWVDTCLQVSVLGGPNLRLGIFIHCSSALFTEAGSLNQTQSSLAHLPNHLTLGILPPPFQAGIAGGPPHPPGICLGI